MNRDRVQGRFAFGGVQTVAVGHRSVELHGTPPSSSSCMRVRPESSRRTVDPILVFISHVLDKRNVIVMV
jgi:hypothetical protein